jgi:hypothetical protein
LFRERVSRQFEQFCKRFFLLIAENLLEMLQFYQTVVEDLLIVQGSQNKPHIRADVFGYIP